VNRSVKVFILVLLALPVLMLSLVGSEATAGEECKVLLQNRCSTCHMVNYVCPRMDRDKGTTYWKWVMYMMENEGVKLTDKENSLLVDCLSSHDAQARSFCPQKK
jgi:hypothetical protein